MPERSHHETLHPNPALPRRNGIPGEHLHHARHRGVARDDLRPPNLTLRKDYPMSGAVLRLKMSIASVKSACDQTGAKSSEEVVLQAVYGKEGTANAQWSKWTPSAGLTMQIN